MVISVMDCDTNEVIFEGEAENFLFANDNDDDIEEVLNMLEDMPIGGRVGFCSNFTDEFVIEKLETDNMYV